MAYGSLGLAQIKRPKDEGFNSNCIKKKKKRNCIAGSIRGMGQSICGAAPLWRRPEKNNLVGDGENEKQDGVTVQEELHGK